MRVNEFTMIIGKNVKLVPYKEHHVPKYHMWMKSEELQLLTASEPLTLEQEYEMQKSWVEDEDKCTFIILKNDRENILKSQEIDLMIGDTNIFLKNGEITTGEIEIMIAEENARGKKLGWESVILMIIYGIKYLKIKIFEAKIATINEKSMKMFKKLFFEEKSISEVFKEVTMEKIVSDEWFHWLESQVHWKVQAYLPNCDERATLST